MTLLQTRPTRMAAIDLSALQPARVRPLYVPPPVDPLAPEPECECQDVERCPVHNGYED
jgi:hypothetical protein